jgi:Stigma-specific protein, Stig1
MKPTTKLAKVLPALSLLAALAHAGCGSSKVTVLSPPDGSATGGTGGIAATAGAGGGGIVGGGPDGGGCPSYQSLCNGACIPTSTDPNNCGGCGVKCPGAQACSGSTCAADCLPGLDVCAGSCVDRQSDSRNCGSCGNVCPTGKGCVKGGCADGVPVGAGPTTCAGGGPPIVIAANQGGCLGTLAQTTFRWGLCSCKDVRVSDKLLVDAYDSRVGLYHPGGLGGGVGVNGGYAASASAEIWGALWCSADTGVTTHASNAVKQELRVGGPLQTSAGFAVGNDAFVDGDVGTSASITIGKTLHTPAASMVSDKVTYGTLTREAVTVPPPCDCQPQQLIPIVDIVAAHRAPNNDDALINLDPAVFTTHGGPRRLDLPCGNYYLTKIDQSEAVTIVAHGRTALYIDGDVHNSDALTFALDPSAELDVFIAGTIDSSDKLTIGSPSYPALSRTYVGSPNGLRLSAGSRIGGNLYAAYGLVSWSAGSDLYGAIFAGDFTASAATTIHYDRAVLGSGDACLPPPGNPPPDGGVPVCSSCKDCGNQACVDGACGKCRTNADCCAPLVCGKGGQCLSNIIP